MGLPSYEDGGGPHRALTEQLEKGYRSGAAHKAPQGIYHPDT